MLKMRFKIFTQKYMWRSKIEHIWAQTAYVTFLGHPVWDTLYGCNPVWFIVFHNSCIHSLGGRLLSFQYYIERAGCLLRPPKMSALNRGRRKLYMNSKLDNYQLGSLAWKLLLYVEPQPGSWLGKTLILGRDLVFLTSFWVSAAEDLSGGRAVDTSLFRRGFGRVATNNAGEALGRRGGRRGWKLFLMRHVGEQITYGSFD